MSELKFAIISLSTFGYFERMAVASSVRGIPTKFFDERPRNDVFTKMFLRLAPKKITQNFSQAHINNVCNEIIEDKYTHVMIVFAETIQKEDLTKFINAGISLSRFTWDSIGNRSHVRKFDHLMKAIGSFDPDDCETYGYKYIPLYCETIEPHTIQKGVNRKFDFYFCGTMHTDRPNLINQMIRLCDKHGWTPKWDLFYHSRWLYKIRNSNNPQAMEIYDRISDTPFPHTQTLENTRNSRVIVDIHHSKQSGLTMRTFEALAQGSVLLTTNERALDLVDSSLLNRVVILDRKNLETSMITALSRLSGPLKDSQYFSLSFDRFLDQIYELNGLKI